VGVAGRKGRHKKAEGELKEEEECEISIFRGILKRSGQQYGSQYQRWY
jgi:hypothetical protein